LFHQNSLSKKKSEKIAVYDLGGGTFDISILELGDGVYELRLDFGKGYRVYFGFDGISIVILLIGWFYKRRYR